MKILLFTINNIKFGTKLLYSIDSSIYSFEGSFKS